MTELDVAQIGADELEMYAAVPSSYLVTGRMVRARDGALGELSLREVPVSEPYVKRYDDRADSAPLAWPNRFDLTSWGLFLARRNGTVVGAAAISPDAAAHAGYAELGSSVLWDVRVAAEHRGTGVGVALFGAAQRWSLAHGFAALVAETQDVNVAACRFYLSIGCTLVHWQDGGYDDVPGEARLLWRRALYDIQRSDQ